MALECRIEARPQDAVSRLGRFFTDGMTWLSARFDDAVQAKEELISQSISQRLTEVQKRDGGSRWTASPTSTASRMARKNCSHFA